MAACVTDGPVAIDCEMVGIGPRGMHSALARVSIVDYNYNVLLDTYCRSRAKVTDYRTQWSGIRESNLRHAPCYSTVRRKVLRILENRIVVAHAGNNDFNVLNFRPNRSLIRDTESCHILRARADIKTKRISLRVLSEKLLGKRIQDGEHDSVVDAQATMALYKLVEEEWEAFLSKPQRKASIKRQESIPKSACRSNEPQSVSRQANSTDSPKLGYQTFTTIDLSQAPNNTSEAQRNVTCVERFFHWLFG